LVKFAASNSYEVGRQYQLQIIQDPGTVNILNVACYIIYHTWHDAGQSSSR